VAIITHFTPRATWQRALEAGVYTVRSLESQGFIHCSTPEQVTQVANHIAREWDDVVLLWIDEEKVGPKIIYENLEGGETLFPHIYGPINLDAVINVTPFPKNENGEYVLLSA
jgi:uncharacterized protein (DUF952 family)